jgi:hypothetical protein
MVRRSNRLLRQTESSKVGGLDGLNLFFGALLGANLGTVERIPLFDYVKLVILLAGTVMTIRIISTSKQRRYAFGLAALYAVLIASMFFSEDLRPEGMTPEEVNRLLATLAIWMVFVLAVELTPARPDDEATPGGSEAESP